MGNPAENTTEDLQNEEIEDEQQKTPKFEDIKNKLTSNEVKKIQNKELSIEDVVKDRNQKAAAAKAEVDNLLTNTESEDAQINLKEYRTLTNEIDETESAEKMEELLEKIKDIPRQKAKQKEKDEEDSKELSPKDPRILSLQNKFNKICDDNEKLIGTKQIPGFEAWFSEQIRKNPTVKSLEEIIKRLEGKEITDRDGLAPRREEYSKLGRLFNKNQIKSPLESTYIKQEGLSERQQFRKNGEEMQYHFEKNRDTGFYSKEMIQKSMQEILLAKNPAEQKKLLTLAKNIARKESESFTYFNSPIQIGKKSIRKMSEASRDKFMDYYKNTDFEERKTLVDNWKKLVENEGKLAKDLEKIYEKDPEGLALALESFEKLNFMQKEKSLKEHQNIVENSEDKEGLQKTLTVKAAHANIDEAARKNIIAKSTQKKYKEWFQNEENYKNPDTKKPGDIKTLKKFYEILVSKTPSKEARNLSAYEAKRDRFKEEVQKLKNINPGTKKEELTKWQDEYDKKSWTDRKQVYKNLIKEQKEQIEKMEEKRKLEKEAGLTKKGKEKLENLDVQKTIKAAMKLREEGKNAEAQKLLLAYNDKDPDHPDIIFEMDITQRYINKKGTGVKLKETTTKQAEEKVKEVIDSDEKIKDEIKEENLREIHLAENEKSEQRDKQNDARERARKKSMEKAGPDELKRDLTEDFYDQAGKTYILNKDETGEEITEVGFRKTNMADQERQSLLEKTRTKQTEIHKNEGLETIFTDETGQKITTSEGRTHQKKSLQKLEEEITEKAVKKTKAESAEKNPSSLNEKIAARRKTKEMIGEKIHSHDILKAA